MRPPRLPLRPALALALAAALTGCASYRPAPRPPAPVVPASADTTDGPARVGLAATLTIPANPFADTSAVEATEEVAVASASGPADSAAAGYAPDQIVVSRYYYDDEGTYYVDEDAAAPADLGWEDDAYYGGYYADYYRYSDPAYYPSLYTYYRPYWTYRPYYSYGWYPTWHRRRWLPAYAGCYGDPYRPARYGPCINVSIHVGVGYAYNPYYYGGYYDPYFYDPYYGYGGYYAGSYGPGYYGPGYYGRPRYSRADIVNAYDRRSSRRDDVDGPTRGLPGTRTSPIVQSMPDPARVPSRRGLSPARYPSVPTDDGAVSRTADRQAVPTRTPTRTGTPDQTGAPTRATIPRAPRQADPARTGAPSRTAPAPGRRAEPAPAPRWTPDRTPAPSQIPRTERSTPRTERRDPEARPLPAAPAPRRTERRAPPPRQESRPAPPPRREESRPAPPRREESRPAPPPRRESRPAPPPRQESRPAPAPRSESGGSRRSSRRGGND